MAENIMLPYGRQTIDEDDIAAVADVLRGDFLTTGPHVQKFEDEILNVSAARYAVACSSGTAALHMASYALELGEGDAVIVPSLTFLATANAARYSGAEVIFADVNPQTALMEVQHLEAALKRADGLNVKAVYPVHMTGQCVDLEKIAEFSRAHDLKIVADASHAFGGQLHDTPVGACVYEDMSVFSFHPVKTIAAGEGGAVVTNSEQYAQRLKTFRSHGMEATPEQGPWCYKMEEPGYNYRITDIQSALAVSQLKKLDRFVARRKEITDIYNALLKDISPHIKIPLQHDYCQPALHLYAPQFDFAAIGIDRASFMTALKERGVGTQVHYIPVHTQPYYQKRYGSIELSGADAYYNQTLSLPLFPAMTDRDVEFVVTQIQEIIGE